MPYVFLFPGQSSRYAGMLDKLVELDRLNLEWIGAASEVAGLDLLARDRAAKAGQAPAFARNLDVQLAVFVANHCWLDMLERRGVGAVQSLGLSLGEYNHLVHIGAVGFADAVRLVTARGRAYDAGPRGWMASVQPIELGVLEQVVASVSDAGVLEIVNLNSPTQHVISGEQAAVQAAVAVLEDEHYVQPVIIEREVPMHSSLFDSVAAAFRPALEAAPFRAPRLPYLPNRLARPLARPTKPELVELLASHVCSPVRWRESIDWVREAIPDAAFVEVGSMSVLHNLLHRKWCRNPRYHTDSREQTRAHFEALVEALAAGGEPAARPGDLPFAAVS